MRTLLAIHAHPDDETITMCGTLARYSAEGVRTVVVTCTRGDLGEVRNQRVSNVDVGAVRDRELETAVQRLGVSRLVRLGYSDSGMAGWPENHRPGAFFSADLTPPPGSCKSSKRSGRRSCWPMTIRAATATPTTSRPTTSPSRPSPPA